MHDYAGLSSALRGLNHIDVICPECSSSRKPEHRRIKCLRIWRVDVNLVSYSCIHCQAKGYVFSDDRKATEKSDWTVFERQRNIAARERVEAEIAAQRSVRVLGLWKETFPAPGTWVEQYLNGRGLTLPSGLERVVRYHPKCPFPDGGSSPALIAAFDRIEASLPDNPLYDQPPVAIHRIRGRGHANKFMLGPVRNAAIMLTPWWEVTGKLCICEGLETGLALLEKGHSPIWALGSAGAIENFPIIHRVHELQIFTDRDRLIVGKSHAGMDAAMECCDRWGNAGKRVVIRMPREGSDYADI